MSAEQDYEISPEERKRIVDELAKNQVFIAPADGFYTFNGGEPVRYKKGDRIKEEVEE